MSTTGPRCNALPTPIRDDVCQHSSGSISRELHLTDNFRARLHQAKDVSVTDLNLHLTLEDVRVAVSLPWSDGAGGWSGWLAIKARPAKNRTEEISVYLTREAMMDLRDALTAALEETA